jgi:hypothetical protein
VPFRQDFHPVVEGRNALISPAGGFCLYRVGFIFGLVCSLIHDFRKLSPGINALPQAFLGEEH